MPAAWKGPAGWRIHRLKGDHAGDWRLTFGIAGGAIVNLKMIRASAGQLNVRRYQPGRA